MEKEIKELSESVCSARKLESMGDATSFEIRIFDHNTVKAFYKKLTKREFLNLFENIEGVNKVSEWL